MLYVADYDTVRLKGFGSGGIKSVPEKECYFPEQLVFPFAIARKVAIENMQAVKAPGEAAPPPPMLFDENRELESVEEGAKLRMVAPGAPKFRITAKRMIEHGATKGCHACETFAQAGHTSECRERFRQLLTESGELRGTSSSLEGEEAPNFLQHSEKDVSEQLAKEATEMMELFGEEEAVLAHSSAPEGIPQSVAEESYDLFFPEGHDVPLPATSAPLAMSRQMAFEMSDYAKDAVQMYTKLSGSIKLKKAATPFCPDGSLSPMDEE